MLPPFREAQLEAGVQHRDRLLEAPDHGRLVRLALAQLVLIRHHASHLGRQVEDLHACVGVDLEIAGGELRGVALPDRLHLAGRVDAPAAQRAQLRVVVERGRAVRVLAPGGREHLHRAAILHRGVARRSDDEHRLVGEHDRRRRRRLRRDGGLHDGLHPRRRGGGVERGRGEDENEQRRAPHGFSTSTSGF
jgi:hypothetical protein